MSSYFACQIFTRFFMSNFICCQIPCARPVSNFRACQISRELRMSWELGHSRSWAAARLSNFTKPKTAQSIGPAAILNNFQELRRPQKLEKFRKFIYNKRGNININIFTIKLDPSQIFRPHKKNAARHPIPGNRRGRAKRLDFSSLSKRGDIWVSVTP